jgi:hypothetical protein
MATMEQPAASKKNKKRLATSADASGKLKWAAAAMVVDAAACRIQRVYLRRRLPPRWHWCFALRSSAPQQQLRDYLQHDVPTTIHHRAPRRKKKKKKKKEKLPEYLKAIVDKKLKGKLTHRERITKEAGEQTAKIDEWLKPLDAGYIEAEGARWLRLCGRQGPAGVRGRGCTPRRPAAAWLRTRLAPAPEPSQASSARTASSSRTSSSTWRRARPRRSSSSSSTSWGPTASTSRATAGGGARSLQPACSPGAPPRRGSALTRRAAAAAAGKYMLVGGAKGHLAMLDWQRSRLECEVQVGRRAAAGRGGWAPPPQAQGRGVGPF